MTALTEIIQDDNSNYNSQYIVHYGRQEKFENALKQTEIETLSKQSEKKQLNEGFEIKNNELLRKAVEGYLKQIISTILKLPVEKLNYHDSFDRYGLDSVVMMKLIRELEENFGELAKTLFFEYKNIETLTDYFLEHYQAKVEELFKVDQENLNVVEEKIVEELVRDNFQPLTITFISY